MGTPEVGAIWKEMSKTPTPPRPQPRIAVSIIRYTHTLVASNIDLFDFFLLWERRLAVGMFLGAPTCSRHPGVGFNNARRVAWPNGPVGPQTCRVQLGAPRTARAAVAWPNGPVGPQTCRVQLGAPRTARPRVISREIAGFHPILMGARHSLKKGAVAPGSMSETANRFDNRPFSKREGPIKRSL